MLKVVGASWVQTRITLFTLLAVVLFGLLTYYYGGSIPASHDGNYAATVSWSRTAGYRLQFWGQNNEPSHIKQRVARAYYRPDNDDDGWASIEIETSAEYPDTVQAHAAGLLEGSLSWQLIYYHWKNTVESACDERQEFCEQARIILDQNTVNIREQARAMDNNDPFWHQVNLFYEQLDGLEVGWRYAVDRSRKDFDIPHQDFLWMNMACDLRDLELMYNASLETNPQRPSLSMALLKLLPNNSSQFLLAHASSSFYSAMLRLQKRYHFGLHTRGGDAEEVPGSVITFTSYPGTIHSQDDFYQISRPEEPVRLTVSGITIKNLNQSLWARARLTDQALMGPRVMAANRLARNGSDWSRLLQQSYSGSGNKQWLVVQPGGDRVKLWVTEQIPGITRSEEQTQTLNNATYWASYGLPFYQEIKDLSGNSQITFESSNQIAKILSTRQENVTDLESLVCLMRSPDLTLVGRSDLSIEDIRQLQEDYQNRLTHSTTESSEEEISNEIPNTLENEEKLAPPHFAHNVKEVFNTIIAMKRLNEELKRMEMNRETRSSEESQEIDETENELPEIDIIVNKRKAPSSEKILSLREFSGVIDLKVSQNDGFLALAGPPYSVTNGAVVVQPFQWSKSPIRDLPHVGQVDVWDFSEVEPKWVWN